MHDGLWKTVLGTPQAPGISISFPCLLDENLTKLVLVLLVSWDTSGAPEEKPTSQSRFEIVWKVATCEYLGQGREGGRRK